jgi:hypothetical protein
VESNVGTSSQTTWTLRSSTAGTHPLLGSFYGTADRMNAFYPVLVERRRKIFRLFRKERLKAALHESAVGPKQTWRSQLRISVLEVKQQSNLTAENVCFWPKADIGMLNKIA